MFNIALDLGSTNLKAALFDRQNNRIVERSIAVPYSRWQDGMVEMDPRHILDCVSGLLNSLYQALNLSFLPVEHLAISSQAQTFLLADSSGQPLTPLLSWMDTRASSLVHEVSDELGEEFHQHCSFPGYLPELMLMKVFWLNKYAKEKLDQARWVLPFPSWLAMKFGCPPGIDPNLAAMSGLYSLREKDWWKQALELCRLDQRKLPDLIQTPLKCKNPDSFTFRNYSIEACYIAGNDQTCGARACLLEDNQLLLTLGTTMVAYRLTGKVPGPYHRESCWGPYPAGGYYELLALSPSTSRMKFNEQQPAMEKHVPKVDLSMVETRCFELFHMVTSSWDESEIPDTILAAGGGSQDEVLLQAISGIFNRPVYRTQADALLGAVIQVNPGNLNQESSFLRTYFPQPIIIDEIHKRYEVWLQYQPSTR